MTISSEVSRITYAGNGATTVFAIPFYFLADTDVVILSVTAAGVSTTLVLSTNYTLTGAGVLGGGSATLLLAPITGRTIIIYRNVAATQTTDYQPNDPFPAETHERALDKLTMIAQRLKELVTRSLTLSDSDVSSASTQLPSPVASNLLGWNAAANAIINYAGAVGVAVTAYMATVLLAANAAAARALLGAGVGNVTEAGVQNQTYTAFTTAGTSTAYTGAPNPAITALADRQSYSVKFSVASGLNPTLAVSGTAPKAIKQYNSAGFLVASTNIPANFISDVQYSLADDCYILCEPVVATASNLTGVTVIASANTIIATTKAPFAADFRSATLSNGVPNSRSLAADASITVPNGVVLAAPPLTTCSSATAAASTTLTLNAAPNQPIQVGQTLFIAGVQSAKVSSLGTYIGGLGTGTVLLDTAVTVTAAAVVFCHPQRIITGLIDNAGTLEAFVCNQAGGTPLDETGLISTQPIAQTCTFTGAIAVTTGILTLSATGTGTFALGQEITGTAVNQGTVVLSLLTGTLGAAGSTYQTNQFTAAASTAMTGKAGYGAYSATARTNVPYKITGYYDEVQSAVGVHAVNPVLVQGAMASAMAALWSIGNGQTYKNKLTERVLALPYYNNTGRAITVSVSVVDGSGGTVFFINGEAVANSGTGASGGNFTITLPIPAGSSYLITAGSGITRYRELS